MSFSTVTFINNTDPILNSLRREDTLNLLNFNHLSFVFLTISMICVAVSRQGKEENGTSK